ncbi:uncharacterized protein BX663DRAFT_432912 [Cokeromyces recurvatus]|uniref:uncharacterized protein n=1 Tax=Cokeromyces recurvatus TaxID=90255 RepID=UPI0022205711|nr:uncharacterized protein BX663DRAFT_432912 [Cokeromyces recurvatus]KAI7904004.1 hypothetical protein BX663DRAFT_432912 [Cokeromyces recurvatus]
MGSKLLSLLAIATFTISSISAQAPTTNLINGQCVQNYDASIDYFPEKVETSNDKGQYFSIEYHNNYKIVKNSNTGHTYVLVQCGTPVPTHVTNDTEIYEIPITKAGILETTIVPYLEMIGAAKTISLIADGSLVSSPCFQKYLNSGDISQLSSTNVTLQAAQLKNVQVQFGANPYTIVHPDINNTVATAQAYEPDVLGRSSWISYYAAFYNLEAVANHLTKTMIDNYNRLKEAASHYKTKPVVAWIRYDAPNQYNNNTASYMLSNAAFKVVLTQDAGQYMYIYAIKDVDILIDEAFIGSNMTAFLRNYNISSTDQSKYKFLTNKKVYREDGILTLAGGYDWFETPVVMADALLEDMINAINPSAPSSNYQRQWLRNIALGEPIKRILNEIKDVSEDNTAPLAVHVLDESNIYHLIGSITGPRDTPYEGGLFLLDIQLSANHPFSPPKVKFITKVYHPNVSSQTDVLNANWSPVMTLRTMLMSIQALLDSPDASSPQDYQVAKVYTNDNAGFIEEAKLWTRTYANTSLDTYIASTLKDE